MLWRAANLLLLVMSVVFISQIVSFYSDKASNALDDGKQVTVDVPTGNISVRELPEEIEENISEETGTTDAENNTETESSEGEEEIIDVKPPAFAASAASGVAILISGVGLNAASTEAVLKLPPEVSLSFSPYVRNVSEIVSEAKKGGHEVLLDLAMETYDYPLSDPGPYALLTHSGKAKNMFRLKTMLGITQGYVGVVAVPEEGLTHSLVTILPIIDELKKHKVAFVYKQRASNEFLKQEARAIGLPYINDYVVLDETLSQAGIDQQLKEVEMRVGTSSKPILILARPYPLTIKKLEKWLGEVKEAGMKISPVSALIER